MMPIVQRISIPNFAASDWLRVHRNRHSLRKYKYSILDTFGIDVVVCGGLKHILRNDNNQYLTQYLTGPNIY